MSLINNLLKDLEKRKIRHQEMPYFALPNNNSSATNLLLRRHTILLLGILVFLLLILFLSLFFGKKHAISSLPTLTTEHPLFDAPHPNNTAAIDATWLKPVSITGITLQVKDNITEIAFLLDHRALYRVVSDEMHNQLAILIDHSQLQSELPAVNYLNTAIEHITTKKINDSIEFIISYAPGVAVKYINLNEEEKNPELVIAFEYQTAAFASSSSANTHSVQLNPLVKTPAMETLFSQQYNNALALAREGRFQAAIDSLTALLKADPDQKDARVSLIAVLIDRGQLGKAQEYIDEGLHLNPTYPPYIELKARMLTTEGKSREALALLQSASPSIDEDPDYYSFMATLYERNNDDLLAAKIYKELLSLNAHNGNWWFGLGLSLEKLGNTQEALNAYKTAMAEGHLNMAFLNYLQQRLQSLQEKIDEKN